MIRAGDGMRFCVLTAGDCAAGLALLARYPNEFRTTVQPIHSAEEAFARFDELTPDLLLVDADAAPPSGLTLCRILKEHPVTMLLPVIAMSRSPKRRIEAFAAGADDFVARTSAPEVFRARVESLVRAGAGRRKQAAAHLAAEFERGEHVRRTFRRYLSPRIADKILSDGHLLDSILAAADVRTRAVVLFADMRGFTGISERLTPQEVVPLLNEYFALLTEVTFQHDGTVFHMAGDCLMVGFGVPLEQPDGPERAVRTAQEMLVRFAGLAQSWKARHQIETGLGIGINEGDVIAGNVGSALYMNYTIIGDTVNVASRLSQRARAGEVLFSRVVKRSLDARGYDTGALELPPITLRGRSSPIDIYCVPRKKRLTLYNDIGIQA
jgi:class 3 adenylate cyclase